MQKNKVRNFRIVFLAATLLLSLWLAPSGYCQFLPGKTNPVESKQPNNERKDVKSDNPKQTSKTDTVNNTEEKSIKDYLKEIKTWLITVGIQVVAIFLSTLIAMFFSNVLSKKLFNFIVKDRIDTELKKRANTLSTVSRYIMLIGILAVGGMMILNKLGIDIAPLLAGAGVLGIALGFGAQNLVKDLISGAFILLEDQIRVGDVIQVADKRGQVEKVTLRMVVLRDLSGNVHFIPSGDIHIVTNMTKSFSMYLFDIGVAYKENTDEVVELVKEVDDQMRSDPDFKDLILAPLEIMGVHKFDSSAVVIRARTKTKPGQQWIVGHEFNRRIKFSFDKNEIEIPFPHMTVFQGTDKSGNAEPVKIELLNN